MFGLSQSAWMPELEISINMAFITSQISRNNMVHIYIDHDACWENGFWQNMNL